MATPLRLVRQNEVRFTPDARRVVLRPFLPGASLLYDGSERIDVVLERLLRLSESDVTAQLDEVAATFAGRHHPDVFDAALADNFAHVRRHFDAEAIGVDRRRLIAMYFTHEYSVEGAALGNPSIVVAPDQQGCPAGSIRVVMSLRSVGEGHRSSISFRTGMVGADGRFVADPVSPFVSPGERSSAHYDREHFRSQLDTASKLNAFATRVLDAIPARFDRGRLDDALRSEASPGGAAPGDEEAARMLIWLADSNYEVGFDPERSVSERVLFPRGPAESNGMEDARLVRFVDDDERVTYYGTYTAFDGDRILPQLVETDDFVRFRISTLRGDAAQNKGIALFPRKIGGQFVALGRHDNVNNFVMRSPEVRTWQTADVIQEPNRPWELTQLGNCGSPIETDDGWLVITHGVGPMRRYTLGALLLDLDDPSKVLGHSKHPILEPDDSERDGYVPNVVYSCGALVHGEHLVVPYGYSDLGASVSSIPLDDLLGALR